MFFGFIGLTFFGSMGLLVSRWDGLKGENRLNSMFSREALFLLNNLLFMGILVICFWGVMFPLVSELFSGQKVTVGPVFYERATGPLWAGLLLLMGVAPLSSYAARNGRALGRQLWKPVLVSLSIPVILLALGIRNWAALLGYWLAGFTALVTAFEFWRGARARHARHGESLPQALWRLASRNRRRYGGYVIHLGVVLMAFGVIGIEIFQTETQGTLAVGESLSLGRYSIVYENLTQFGTPDGRSVSRAEISVYRQGRSLGQLFPRQDFYVDQEQNMTIPGVRSSLEDDFYVLLVGWEPIAQQGATFKIYHNPLVNFVWFGGLVFIFGTAIAAWPQRDQLELVETRIPASASYAGAD
jgi:cytochrome c-type biogenesis protein CcmF